MIMAKGDGKASAVKFIDDTGKADVPINLVLTLKGIIAARKANGKVV